jgi:hypothetical protein
MAVATLVRRAQHDATARNRRLDRPHDQPLAELPRAVVAKRDDFRKVVSGVDVQQRKRKRPGSECFLREAQQNERILAARKEQRGIAALARDLAQDVNRLGLEPPEMVGIRHLRHARRCRMNRMLEKQRLRHVETPA